MDSKKALFAILGVALTTVIGFLLTAYKDSSRRKKIANKINGKVDEAEEAIKETVSDVKNQIKTMGEGADRMVNEGGNAL